MIAAAGPALRGYLGRHWRGTLVSVCSGRCVVVRLSDWCLCTGNGGRLIDLSDDAFAQLAPLSRGVIRVSITRAVRVPPPPQTDTVR
jgi:rare lipoprotein A (peptidoglycan hydrolase)